jgi:hypothetical protein
LGRWEGVSPTKGRIWVLAVFILAVPAIFSPLLFVRQHSPLPPALLGPLVDLLSHPRWWATAATLVGMLGARRFAESRIQEGVVSLVIVIAWSLGCDTVAIIDHMF